jgi:hypothetical protein
MSRLYIGLGVALALLIVYWLFSDHFIGIGKKLCEGVNEAALVKQLESANANLRREVERNAALAAQHDADLRQMQADAVAAAGALSHVRVRVHACSNGVPQAAAAPGGPEYPGPLDGGSGEGVEEIDLSPIVPDLAGCELDASDLEIMKAWARGITQP